MTPATRRANPHLAAVFRNELDALETYHEARSRLATVPFAVMAAYDSHLFRVAEIQRLHPSLVPDPTIQGHGFDHGWSRLAAGGGGSALVNRLAACEEATIDDYRRRIESGGFDDASLALVQAVVLPEQATTARSATGLVALAA